METRMWIVELEERKKFIPKHLGKWSNHGEYILHVAKGGIQIQTTTHSTKTTHITAEKSIKFTQEMWKKKHVVSSGTNIFAMEFRAIKENTNIQNKEIEKITSTPIHEQWLKWRYSFIRETMSSAETRNKILFMDAEFTCRNQDGNKSPVAVTILNYTGCVMRNAERKWDYIFR